jgi:hypothetical protein
LQAPQGWIFELTKIQFIDLRQPAAPVKIDRVRLYLQVP